MALATRIAGLSAAQIDQGLRAHMNKVYANMSVGMLITALAAWAISGLATTTDPTLAAATLKNGIMLNAFGAAIYLSPLVYVIMFAPLAVLLLGMGKVMQSASAPAARLFFYAFGALFGLSISSIFVQYTGVSIVQTFLVTAIAFSSLSIWGYTTKRDLSGWGRFLMMALFGLIAAILVQFVMGVFFGLTSGLFSMVISMVGVVLFSALTAYDTQTIKNEYLQHAHHGDQEWLDKSAVFGSLRLYLDFLNLFMFLLHFLGNNE